MAIYEVNGVHYDIDTDDPEVAKVKIREHLGQPAEQPANPDINVAPQGISTAKELASLVPQAGKAIAPSIQQGAQWVANRPLTTTLADIAGVTHTGIPLGSTLNAAKNAVMGGGPTLAETYAGVRDMLSKGSGMAASGARNLGGALVSGLTAPESLFALPYQGAAYEQERIRQNPNALEYATNPYAMQQRGQAPTQGAAGAMNRRNAIAGQQYGGVSPQEQAILQQDAIDRQIRLLAAQKALQPIAPQQQGQ